uniref:4-hydroxyphenylpyruvate dioxygenase n=1 Tax=Latimeria chalumnae TaxID=7897 RepID=H3B022_LATCH
FLSRLSYIALHVANGEWFASDLVNKYKFQLFATRITDKAKQLAFKKGSAVFIVNESLKRTGNEEALKILSCNHHASLANWQTQFLLHEKQKNCLNQKFLYDVQPSQGVSTVSNVCFEVENVEKSFKSLSEQGCPILIPPTKVHDEFGFVTYSVIKSIVGNVCHTLIDKTKYGGEFLPGFSKVEHSANGTKESGDVTHFDHITYACPQRYTPMIMEWYEKCFGFKRFFINKNEDITNGYVISGDGVGLRLTAMHYWKCSEVGMKLPITNQKEPDCKFVMAESLTNQGRNQVDTFLDQHHGAGIQHVGLYTSDIINTSRTLMNSGVQFVAPPRAYYTEIGKQQEILEAGHDPQLLSQCGILLDAEIDDVENKVTNLLSRYLMQVFTKPVFKEETFFLELIERQGARGFGEGNIKALWRSVQAYMDQQEKKLTSHIKNMLLT